MAQVNSSLFVAAAIPTPAVDLQLRPFVQDAHCTAVGVVNEWPELPVDDRRRYRSRDKHARGQLRHTMHWPPCLDLLSSCHAHCGPFCLL